jgi:endoglucanase
MSTTSAPGTAAPAHRARELHTQWLLEITQIPTVAGREERVVAWIRGWVAQRPELELIEDSAGNLVVRPRLTWGAGRGSPVFITAHLDHPAFVVERVIGPGAIEIAFRGGVMDPYFERARVRLHSAAGSFGATITGPGQGSAGAGATGAPPVFKTYLAELDSPAQANIGDIVTWELPEAQIDGLGLVHTHACDDLAALAAALSAYDVLRGIVQTGSPTDVQDVRLLFTRAEEIGFVGAIAACKLETMPKGSRVIALENSRAFADSPIGGGPIVRVGDRMSIFTPRLTAACARRAEQIANRPAQPTATRTQQEIEAAAAMRWQRKLMAGGACEATVFCAYGYDATCLCLPLGNYHNMSDLAAVQDGKWDTAAKGPPRVAREYIALADYNGMVDLLVAIGQDLPEADPALDKIEVLYATRAFVLKEGR